MNTIDNVNSVVWHIEININAIVTPKTPNSSRQNGNVSKAKQYLETASLNICSRYNNNHLNFRKL